jgi:sulfur-carrier protein adenylyltransferase/sulfurtransferase
MRWRQFLTPVRKVDAGEARRIMEKTELQVLDVRQPGEYRSGHIPGARLIPIDQLTSRLDEIDPKAQILVYCAVGGRSRVAAQILAGKGYQGVLNLAGGYKAWTGASAYGDREKGLEFFGEQPAVGEILEVAVAMENALGQFYERHAATAKDEELKFLFERLAASRTAMSGGCCAWPRNWARMSPKLTGKPPARRRDDSRGVCRDARA